MEKGFVKRGQFHTTAWMVVLMVRIYRHWMCTGKVNKERSEPPPQRRPISMGGPNREDVCNLECCYHRNEVELEAPHPITPRCDYADQAVFKLHFHIKRNPSSEAAAAAAERLMLSRDGILHVDEGPHH